MPDLAHPVYTDDSGAGPYVIFPTHAHQILSNCIHILGVSILSYCFALRTGAESVGVRQWWAGLTWARLLVVLVFLDSWIFLAFSGILVNGVGLSLSVPVCSLGIYACIIFYAGSKALIYLFLVERVWIVWSAGNTLTRFQSRIYKVCAVVVLGFCAIFVNMIFGRIAQIREDGVCVIGLRGFATIPLLAYDLFVNIFLTLMFLWALYREQSISQRLRRLARRTGLAAFVALTTSSVNIIILASLDGKQLGWVCLGACATDVTINALVLFWVTAGGHKDSAHGGKHGTRLSLPTLHVPVSFVRDPSAAMQSNLNLNTAMGLNGSMSLKEQDGESSPGDPRTISIRGSHVHLCDSPYPHTHRFTCEYGQAVCSNCSSPTSPTSAHAAFFGSESHQHSSRSRLRDETEEDDREWDIADSASSAGHRTLTEDRNHDLTGAWRIPSSNSPYPSPLPLLSAHDSSKDSEEPESPTHFSLATSTSHGSRACLAPRSSQHSASYSEFQRAGETSRTTRSYPKLTSTTFIIEDSTPVSALPILPKVKSPSRTRSRRLQRTRPRSASSPPSTAMSRETAFSGSAETGDSSTLVCQSTCAAGSGLPTLHSYDYDPMKAGESSSHGQVIEPYLRLPRRTNTSPGSLGLGVRDGKQRSGSRLWRSFGAVGAVLGLSRTRSWRIGEEDLEAAQERSMRQSRDGSSSGSLGHTSTLGRCSRPRPRLSAIDVGPGAGPLEVTVTTRTTVGVVDRPLPVLDRNRSPSLWDSEGGRPSGSEFSHADTQNHEQIARHSGSTSTLPSSRYFTAFEDRDALSSEEGPGRNSGSSSHNTPGPQVKRTSSLSFFTPTLPPSSSGNVNSNDHPDARTWTLSS